MEPLAYRLRPQTLDDIVGQQHLVGAQGVIRKLVNNKKMTSIILYGSPGIGKTTIAQVICNELGCQFFSFNASVDNKATLKSIIDKADDKTVLIVDEIHRMKKDIQDYLLPYVENGKVTLIGLTTVNPYMSVNAAIRSRALIYRLNPLTNEDLKPIIHKALNSYEKHYTIEQVASDYLIQMANGEVRVLINMIEAIVSSMSSNENNITFEICKSIILRPAISFDKNEDNYYDTLSGLQKSIRGSDVDASIHYLAKLLVTEDFTPLIRRLYAIFYEDISIANPSIGPRLRAACESAMELGMPEARLPFASIVVEMALSPKSNSTMIAIDSAISDIENGKSGTLPLHLKNTYSFDPSQGSYIYPHDYPGAWVNQQYLPDKIKDQQYYHPKTTSKYESGLKERYDAINKAKKKSQ